MVMLKFRPDIVDVDSSESAETALFVGVREDPALESTQLRWQIQLDESDSVDLATGEAFKRLGGALFITTREPVPEIEPGATPAPIGWLRWIADKGRKSYQIQLAMSRVGFDRISAMALQGKYPRALITFKEESGIESAAGADGDSKVWDNTNFPKAFISEFTLSYDLRSKA